MDNRKKVTVAATIILVFIVAIIAARYPAPIASIVVPDNYATIQEAIEHAFAGQTVYVKSGVYTQQQITINKPLSLIGEDPANTVIVGINNIKYSPPYVITVSSDNVKISGFTIMNGSLGGIRIEKIGSVKQPTDVTIAGNNIVNNGDGVSGLGGSHWTITDNNFVDNSIYGVYLAASHSTVSGNRITENGIFGMIIDSCSDVSVTNNVISSNGHQANIQGEKGGVCLRWFGDFRLFANNITGNSGDGVQFGEGVSNSVVHDNNILGNTVGVNLFNFLISNNSEGIGVGVGNQVYQNNLVNTQNAVVQTAFTYGNISNIAYTIGNGTDMVSWDNGVVGNYWGDYNGTGTYPIDQNNIDHHPLTNPVTIAEKTLNAPSLQTNATQIINQVIFNTEYSGQWYAIYDGPYSTTVGLGGNSSRSIIISRPDGVSHWIIDTSNPGFQIRGTMNLTVSISELNGHNLSYETVDSFDGALITLNVDVDNPTNNVTYDIKAGVLNIM